MLGGVLKGLYHLFHSVDERSPKIRWLLNLMLWTLVISSLVLVCMPIFQRENWSVKATFLTFWFVLLVIFFILMWKTAKQMRTKEAVTHNPCVTAFEIKE